MDYLYMFESLCKEVASFSLGDGAHKIFYNVAKLAVMPNGTLKSFFRFLSGAPGGFALSVRLAAMAFCRLL